MLDGANYDGRRCTANEMLWTALLAMAEPGGSTAIGEIAELSSGSRVSLTPN
jgi:hypothetical protein